MGSIIIIIGFSPLSPEHAAGTLYLRTMALGAPPLAGSAISTGALEGLGVMGRALGVTLASVLVNFILDPLLIWGLGPFPRLGVAGAAVGTSVAAGVGLVLQLALLRRAGLAFELKPPDPKVIGRLFAIGAPMCVSGVAFCGVYLALSRLLSALVSGTCGPRGGAED